MSNLNFPHGFVPVDDDCQMHYYPVAPTNTQIGENDLVERRADGYIWPAQVSSTTIIGVAAHNVKANTGGFLAVYDDFDTVFEAQSNDATIDAQTDFDLNYDIVASAPDAITGRSTMQINGASQAATATLPIKILRVPTKVTKNGNALGANVLVECIINNHLLKSTGVIG